MGRWMSVKPKKLKPMKMYVNGLSDDTTKEDFIEYFSKFGDIIDSFVPTPFKNFAFFTFADSEDGFRSLRQTSHILKGKSINLKIRDEDGIKSGAHGGDAAPKYGNAGGF